MQILIGGRKRLGMLALSASLFLPVVAHAQTGGTLKVLDWNTHHGVGSDGRYDLQRFVTWIARSGAHVVSLNEVEKFTGWGDEDQPARYAALLKAATGKTWYHTFAQRDGGTNGQGNLILSTIPFETTDDTTLSYSRSVARAQILVGGIRVNIFSTHLDADSSTRRAQQMAELKAWAGSFSQQHIFAGDFNAWPGASEITNMTAFARDAWAVAMAAGTATAYSGNEAGNTRNSRIDYIWYSKSASSLVLKGAQVLDTRDSSGVTPSDHRPVTATFQVGAGGGSTSTTVAAIAPAKVTADFDGDHKADPTVYRPGTGEWFVAQSRGGVLQGRWGVPSLGDVPVSGDYDGDGRQDLAVYRAAGGTWHLRHSSTGAYQALTWGATGDLPVPGDYDSDGRTDVAVFRPSTGGWYVRYSSTGAMAVTVWGVPGDVPVLGDYDGDRKIDIAVFRPSSALWYVRYSKTGTTATLQWGLPGDVTVPGDYDGDGRTDLAVFRPLEANWYIHSLSTRVTTVRRFGLLLDRPVPGDYDGDGKTDVAVFRPSNAVWYLRNSSNGALSTLQWGLLADLPVTVH